LEITAQIPPVFLAAGYKVREDFSEGLVPIYPKYREAGFKGLVIGPRFFEKLKQGSNRYPIYTQFNTHHEIKIFYFDYFRLFACASPCAAGGKKREI
jgi:hypothetical protein